MFDFSFTTYAPGVLHVHLDEPDSFAAPDDWMTEDISDSVAAAVAAGCPVTVVDCDNRRSSAAAELRETVDSPLLQVMRDEDLTLVLPEVGAGDFDPLTGPWTRDMCDVPTLGLAARAAAEHEANHGPGILLLDNIEAARPYAVTGDPDRAGSRVGALRVTASQARLWAARDLALLGRHRRHGITVAVTRSLPLFEEVHLHLLDTEPSMSG